MEIITKDWGKIDYQQAWNRQKILFDELIHAKLAGESYENHIIMCEHLPVYTLGKSGDKKNMLLSESQLEKIGATLFHIDRGGDITFHGPGQLV